MRLAGRVLIKKMENIEQERQRLRSIWLHPRSEYLEEANKVLGSPLVREASGEDLLRRPEMTYDILTSFNTIQTGNGRQRSRRTSGNCY